MSDPTPPAITPEERTLLYLAATGHSPAQAARAACLPPAQARQALDNLQRRLGLPSRSALIARAIVRRWV